MLLETQRLIIRDLKMEDAASFAEMAADGSLHDCGFDKDCSSWITEWIAEAKEFAARDNPNMDYLAYTIVLKGRNVMIGSIGCSYYEEFQETGITYFIGAQYRNNGYAAEAVKAYTQYFLHYYNAPKMIATVREENIPSYKILEKTGFLLHEKRMYQDLYDDQEKLYYFYQITNPMKG